MSSIRSSHLRNPTGRIQKARRDVRRSSRVPNSTGCSKPEFAASIMNTASSWARTLESLQRQTSSLQNLLYAAYGSGLEAAEILTCPSSECATGFPDVASLHKHIRYYSDTVHRSFAVLINETHCSVCSKTMSRPQDLVKHERHNHGETYSSRIQKFLRPSEILPLPFNDAQTCSAASS